MSGLNVLSTTQGHLRADKREVHVIIIIIIILIIVFTKHKILFVETVP